MGRSKNKQIIILIVILLIAGGLVHSVDDSVTAGKSIELQQVLNSVGGYDRIEELPVADWLVNSLKLDDVSQKRFRSDDKVVEFYAGYYFSIDKLSAAHSPLVCMPGQGWLLERIEEKTYSFDGHEVNYAEVVAKQGEQKLLMMYWFQAYDKSAPNMYVNIYNTLLNVIKKKPPEHAFVRVTIPLANASREEAEKAGLNFVKSFYPVFLDYVKDKGE